MIRLKVTNGSSHISTSTGRMIAVAPDGTIEASEEDAKALLAAEFKRIK